MARWTDIEDALDVKVYRGICDPRTRRGSAPPTLQTNGLD